MEALFAITLGLLTASGVYLLLRARTFPVVLGLTLISYAVNLFLFATGRLVRGAPPVLADGATAYTDPLPQALVLTAIVISMASTAVMLTLAALGRDDDTRTVESPERTARKLRSLETLGKATKTVEQPERTPSPTTPTNPADEKKGATNT